MYAPSSIFWARVITTILATAILWWFLFPDRPDAAVLDGLLSSAIATYVEARLGAWGIM
jgi:hypothetical protein